MTGEKVVQVAKNYANQMRNGVVPMPDDQRLHLIEMADKIVGFVGEGRTEKAMRWLGFMQGVLWAHRLYAIEQLADHNRPHG